MASRFTRKGFGITPGKLAMVAGLAIVLIGVQMFNGSEQALSSASRPQTSGRGDSSPPAQSTDNSRVAALHSADEVPSAAFPRGARFPVASPAIDFEEILRHDPFARPVERIVSNDDLSDGAAQPVEPFDASLVEELSAETQELLETLKNQGVSMIFRNNNGISAMIGPYSVQVGDVLDDRLRITEINEDGVVIEAVEPADRP